MFKKLWYCYSEEIKVAFVLFAVGIGLGIILACIK